MVRKQASTKQKSPFAAEPATLPARKDEQTAVPKRDVRPTAGDGAPPLAAPLPPGTMPASPVPLNVEAQAQKLIDEAGSCDAAKSAVDVAAEREHIPDFQEDHFALRFGFASRAELRHASKPLVVNDGVITWATELSDRRWICWSKDDMSASQTFNSLEELQKHLQVSAA